MLLLRLTQRDAGAGEHLVEISVEGDGPRRTGEVRFAFALARQDEENLRWYLEESLLYPQEPRGVVERIERRIAEIGEELFRKIFDNDTAAHRCWSDVADRLNELRVEIVTTAEGAAALPWELLREPETKTALALAVRAFVRALPEAGRALRQLKTEAGPVRILLAICRPRGGRDAGFRSVASHLIKALTEANRRTYHLEVLRPPAFDQLAEALRAAHAAGEPFHVLHFDGHGGYLDLGEIERKAEERGDAHAASLLRELLDLAGEDLAPQAFRRTIRDLYPHPVRPGHHSYIVFEDPGRAVNQRLVDGPELGLLLAQTGVSALVLNACRSAYARQADDEGDDEAHTDDGSWEGRAVQAHSWPTLAQEVMDAGVPAVVAMRYNLWIVTAAQFVADLYRALASGEAVGEAVTLGRKRLDSSPERAIAYDPVRLQDWPVPVVYEAAPLQLFPEASSLAAAGLAIEVSAGASVQGGEGLDPALPPPPDAGFFGRDETVLALDRAFDRDHVVLLHGWAGSGKTSTAAEFARWYKGTEGVEGPVLFSTFERYLPLSRVLDRIGHEFGSWLEQNGVQWLTLDDEQRRDIALKVLRQVPILWIWDNVEPVAGFPRGTESAWSADEQTELLHFLEDLCETQAKVLLTSRRGESSWLGDLPIRVQIPPLREAESLQLVRALAEKLGRRLAEFEDWRPLLAFAQGNPMTLTVLAREALRRGWTTRAEIDAYAARLRAGEAAFSDEASEGRSRSLGASLAYGFATAFTEEERKVLALLHLFQGVVEVDVLRLMGNPEETSGLPEVLGMTREVGIALLDRAAEIGHLTRIGDGWYAIHPALPWFFAQAFETSYGEAGRDAAARAYAEAEGRLAVAYQEAHLAGDRKIVDALRVEEPNLLQARRLALAHGWRVALLSSMHGLHCLYEQEGRRSEWKRLVEEIAPAFVDPHTDGPAPGAQEPQWDLVNRYRMDLAVHRLDFAEAERLLERSAAWNRGSAAPLLDRPVESLTGLERNAIRALAGRLHDLALVQSMTEKEECVPTFREALALSERMGDRGMAAVCAFNLGAAYAEVEALRDFDEAERWIRASLDWLVETDGLGRGRCNRHLGRIARQRFRAARLAGRPPEELLVHLREAARLSQRALELLPLDAVVDLGEAHHELGDILSDAGEADQALSHYRQAIQYSEQSGRGVNTGLACYNIAVSLHDAGRQADALEYAEAALRCFESAGAIAAKYTENARRTIALLSASMHNP